MTARSGSPVLMVGAAAVLLACSAGRGSTPATAAPQPPPHATGGAPAGSAPAPPAVQAVKIGTTPSISNGGRYIAEERGYFREEGIEIEVIPMDTSAKQLPALAAGQIEIAGGGVAAGLFNAIVQGIPVRIVLDQWTASPGNGAGGLIMRKDLIDGGQVREYRDLRGLTIAITSKGHATQFVLNRGLAQAGLALADVETTELAYPDMSVALANRSIDGAVSIEPYAAQAVGAGFAARFKAWPELMPNDNAAMQMYSEVFAGTRNDAARRYATAYVRGVRDYERARTGGRDRDDVIALLQRNTPLKDRAIYDQMPWPAINPDGRVNPGTIGEAQDWFFDNGYVPVKADLSKAIDLQFAEHAVAALGPYQP